MISRSRSKTTYARCWKERIRKVSGVSSKGGTSQCSQDLCLRHGLKRREDSMMVNVAQKAVGIEEICGAGYFDPLCMMRRMRLKHEADMCFVEFAEKCAG